MRIRALILVWALAGTALAEEPVESVKRGDLGIRYWLSTGETKSSHNAQSLDPTLGNPTSVLLYENLDANMLEFFGRQDFQERWFLNGILGVGRVKGGFFDDEDFKAGQVKFSDTSSSGSTSGGTYGCSARAAPRSARSSATASGRRTSTPTARPTISASSAATSPPT
jgi:hypothetical protein